MKDKKQNKFQQAFILILLFIVLMGFIGMIKEFLVALVLAAIFAGLLYPFYNKILLYFKNRSVLAASTVIIVSILAIGFPLAILTGMITNEAIYFSQKTTPIVKEILDDKFSLSKQLPSWLPLQDKFGSINETILKKASDATNAIGSWLVSSLSSATKGTAGFLMSLFIMFYAMFYFLINGKKLLDSFSSLLPLSKKDYDELMNRGLMVTKASLKGIIIIGFIQALLVTLGFWVIGFNAAVFWGSVVFILSAIPGLGAPIVWVPAVIYLILTGSIGWGISLTIWGIIVVGLVDNLLRPWIVGNDSKLPDLVILISILGGIATFGPVGIILGPVIAALLDTVLNIYKKSFK
ncbi:AI-2E family transporter [Malaciobacter molluscorum]|uniref:AI-2E family transporter n=1 Tax=Malaciobacter molluscorum TaxID=1032072 RepID=UPI00100A5AB7|nr:AI-2E family transporter [Malaciobacter molluscorum]RXJ97501.1 AI-2E family transporter [Malaciobacter molluscorum]